MSNGGIDVKRELVLRAVDESGKIVLPTLYRTALNIEAGDRLYVDHMSSTLLHIRKAPAEMAQVDELGRISLGGKFAAGTTFEVVLGDDYITLFTTVCTCEQCGGTDTLSSVNGKILCGSCSRKTTV